MNLHIMIGVCAAVLVSGCASVNTPMKHADGRVINCGAAGLGIIGVPAALIIRENCVSNARTNGFVTFDEQAVTQPAPAKSAYQGRVSIALPAGWVRKPAPAVYTNAIDYAANATLGAYMLLSYVPRSEITDLAVFAETKKASQLSKLRDGQSTETAKFSIGGRTAFSANIDGLHTASGTRHVFRQTIIDSGAEVIMVSVWTSSANYTGLVKEQIDAIENGIAGL